MGEMVIKKNFTIKKMQLSFTIILSEIHPQKELAILQREFIT